MREICPRCGVASPVRFAARDHNRRISDELFRYRECPRCALIFIEVAPPDLGAYYPAGYHEVPQTWRARAAEAAADRFKVDIVRRHVAGGALLEIGAAQGSFARAAKRAGFGVDVIEMDAECCRRMERDGIRAVQHDAPHEAMASLGTYDAIALWHSLEHLPEPWACLAAAGAHLRPGGILVVATPNPDSVQFRIFDRFWAHLDAPRHLQLVPHRVLGDELARHGLRLVELTDRDPVTAGYNRMGWHWSVANVGHRLGARPPAWVAGKALAIALWHWSGREMDGCAYTAAFVKSAASA